MGSRCDKERKERSYRDDIQGKKKKIVRVCVCVYVCVCVLEGNRSPIANLEVVEVSTTEKEEGKQASTSKQAGKVSTQGTK